MTKTVTDEMVGRAMRAFEAFQVYGDGAMRQALLAALNPPAEPEVTEEMIEAGWNAALPYIGAPARPVVRAIYRAMYSARPKGEDLKPPHGGEDLVNELAQCQRDLRAAEYRIWQLMASRRKDDT